MKKHFYYAMAFLLFLTVSCVSEKVDTDPNKTNYNAAAVWEYNGDNTTLTKVIQELKSGSDREKLERRLLKNDVLWEEAKFVLIDNKKRILIPFLSINKDNVIGILSLVKDAEGKTTFDMVVRKDLMNKSSILPFWKRDIWAGYFMALDKDILGIKNGSPGLAEKLVVVGNSKVKNNTSKTMQTVCGDVPVREICITYSDCDSYDGGETWVNCYETNNSCWYEYDWRCWDVPDDGNDSGNDNDQPCPAGYERDAYGNCKLIDQCANTDPETIFNSLTISDELISITSVNAQGNSKSSKTSSTDSNFYTWRCINDNLYYSIISTEIGTTKLTGNPNYPKEWVSFTHASLSPKGTLLCGSVSITSEAHIATVGKYFAEMELSVGLNVTSEAAGTPINRYFYYTPKKTFSAN
jgi:hypothetical protein